MFLSFDSGFHVKLANGFTISTMFGAGRAATRLDLLTVPTNATAAASTAEVMVWDSFGADLDPMTIGVDFDSIAPSGNAIEDVKPDELARLFAAVAAFPASATAAGIAKAHNAMHPTCDVCDEPTEGTKRCGDCEPHRFCGCCGALLRVIEAGIDCFECDPVSAVAVLAKVNPKPRR